MDKHFADIWHADGWCVSTLKVFCSATYDWPVPERAFFDTRALCSIHCPWWKCLQCLPLSYLHHQVQPQQRWLVSIISTTFFDLRVVSWRCLSLHRSIKVLSTSLYYPSGSPLTEKRGPFPHLHPLTSGGGWRRSCCRSAFTPESNDPAVNQGIYQLRLWLSMIRMCQFKQWQRCQHQHITASRSWGRNSVACRFSTQQFWVSTIIQNSQENQARELLLICGEEKIRLAYLHCIITLCEKINKQTGNTRKRIN